MTGQQLKNSILQLAIEGKLVSQDPKDEPASVLLQRIREEKQRLVKEGKLKKKDLTSTPITEEDKPFDIPETWEWCRISDLSTVVRGGSPRPAGSPEYYDGPIPFMCVADITKDEDMYVNNASKSIKEAGLKKTRMVDPNTLLLSNSGATLGVPKINTFPTTFNDGIAAFLYLNDVLKPYLYWFFKSQTDILRNFNQGTAQPNLNTDLIRSILLPLPPLSEQRRIVARIEELMPLVKAYGKAQEELEALNAGLPEALKKSILQEAIQGRLVPQDANDEPASVLLARIRKEKEQLVKAGKLKKKDLTTTPITEEDKPFDIPESWEWCRLGDIFSHNNGKQLNRADNQGEFHDYITTSNLYWDRFELKEIRQMLFTEDELVRCTATKGDLLVCEGGDVGRSAIWNYDYDICIQNHIHRVRAYLPLCTRFFLYLLMFNKYAGLIGGKGIGIQGFSAKALHNTLVALPPLAEQRRIVAKIEELFAILQAK